MFFQLMLYDFIKNLTLEKFIKYIFFLIILGYYTAYNLIERGHPGLHKARMLVIQHKYAMILQPYEPLFLLVCSVVLALFVFYMAYCYWKNRHSSTETFPVVPKQENNDQSYQNQELLFLKEQVQLIQQRIEAIERG